MLSLDAVIALFLLGILGTVAESIRRRDGAALANSAVVIAVSLSPVVLDTVSAATVRTGPELTAWLGLAGLLHMLGMLGVYEAVWWWDHVTHTVSAALVAALCYGGLLVLLGDDRLFIGVFAVAFTLAAGICWELLELVARALGRRFDIEPVLVHYGWDDTIFDLGFDILGALLVVALHVDVFVPLAAQAPSTTSTVLLTSTTVIFGGSVAMAVFLTLADEWTEPTAE